jgi:hypothetical protein
MHIHPAAAFLIAQIQKQLSTLFATTLHPKYILHAAVRLLYHHLAQHPDQIPQVPEWLARHPLPASTFVQPLPQTTQLLEHITTQHDLPPEHAITIGAYLLLSTLEAITE